MISLIFPVYNEEDSLEALYTRLVAAIEEMSGEAFEFIFVDDCSSDKTPTILEEIARLDPRVKTIRFARNCGSHAAVAAGLRFCRARGARTDLPRELAGAGRGGRVARFVR